MPLAPRVLARLRSLSDEASTLPYPDTDNQMEDGVFSFAKRTDEARVWADLVDATLAHGPRPSPGAALDLGCGLGAHAGFLAVRFEDVVLIDADRGRAQAAARRLGWAMGERVFVGRAGDDALLHPDLAGAFSLAQMIQVLGHLPIRSVAPALATLFHLTAPGGHALVAIPFTGGAADLTFVTALDASDGRVKPTSVEKHTYDALARSPQPGKLPVRHFSMTSVMSAFAMAGFVHVETRPYHWFSHDTGDIFVMARRPA